MKKSDFEFAASRKMMSEYGFKVNGMIPFATCNHPSLQFWQMVILTHVQTCSDLLAHATGYIFLMLLIQTMTIIVVIISLQIVSVKDNVNRKIIVDDCGSRDECYQGYYVHVLYNRKIFKDKRICGFNNFWQ